MANSETLREFVVSLGFTVDNSKLAKFEQAMVRSTKVVLEFGLALTAIGVGVVKAVDRFAANMETLYYESQRVGSSATAIKAYTLAIENMGGTASDAQGAMEGLAHSIRNNPAGIGGFLSGIFGQWAPDQKFDPDDTAHDLLALSEAYQHMVDVLGKQQGTMLALQYSSQLGLPENGVLAMMRPGFAESFQKAQQLLLNNGFDKAAKDAHDFMVQLRDLKAQLEVFGVQVLDAIQVKFGLSLQTVNDWLQKNGPAMAARLADIADSATGKFLRAAEAVGRFIDRINAIENSPITRWLDRFNTTTNRWAVDTYKGVTGGVTSAWRGASGAVDNFEDYRNRLPNSIKMLTSLGLSPAAATGVAANLLDESDLNAAAVGDHGAAYGIAQWHKPYQDMFQQVFGHSMVGSSLEEQLQFLRYTIERQGGLEHSLNAPLGASAAAQLFANTYERPAAGAGAAAARGALATQIYNNVTVHIDGSSDPASTAQAVKRTLQGITADSTRNLIGAAAQ